MRQCIIAGALKRVNDTAVKTVNSALLGRFTSAGNQFMLLLLLLGRLGANVSISGWRSVTKGWMAMCYQWSSVSLIYHLVLAGKLAVSLCFLCGLLRLL